MFTEKEEPIALTGTYRLALYPFTARPLLLPNSSISGSVQPTNMASWFTGRIIRKLLGGLGRTKRRNRERGIKQSNSRNNKIHKTSKISSHHYCYFLALVDRCSFVSQHQKHNRCVPFLDRDLFETTGTSCFEAEGGEDVWIGFCVPTDEDWFEFTGITAVLPKGPSIATSGDGLNLVNPTLGRGLLGPPGRRKWLGGVLWTPGRCTWLGGELRPPRRRTCLDGEPRLPGRCTWLGETFPSVCVGVG